MTATERLPEPSNPLGMDGIEFHRVRNQQTVESAACCSKMGFAAIARHRSREVNALPPGRPEHRTELPRRAGQHAAFVGNRAARARRHIRAPALPRSRCLGHADPRFGHGAQYSRHPRRRGQPDLLRGSLPGFLDLRRGFCLSRKKHTNSYSSRLALVRRRAGDPREPDRRLARFLPATIRLHGAAARTVLGVHPKGTLLQAPAELLLAAHRPPPGAEEAPWDEDCCAWPRHAGCGGRMRALTERGIVFIDRGSVQPATRARSPGLYGEFTFELSSPGQAMNLEDSGWIPSPWRPPGSQLAAMRGGGFTQVMLWPRYRRPPAEKGRGPSRAR